MGRIIGFDFFGRFSPGQESNFHMPFIYIKKDTVPLRHKHSLHILLLQWQGEKKNTPFHCRLTSLKLIFIVKFKLYCQTHSHGYFVLCWLVKTPGFGQDNQLFVLTILRSIQGVQFRTPSNLGKALALCPQRCHGNTPSAGHLQLAWRVPHAGEAWGLAERREVGSGQGAGGWWLGVQQ